MGVIDLHLQGHLAISTQETAFGVTLVYWTRPVKGCCASQTWSCVYHGLNPLAPGRCGNNFKSETSPNTCSGLSSWTHHIALWWCHYLKQCWLRTLSPYAVMSWWNDCITILTSNIWQAISPMQPRGWRRKHNIFDTRHCITTYLRVTRQCHYLVTTEQMVMFPSSFVSIVFYETTKQIFSTQALWKNGSLHLTIRYFTARYKERNNNTESYYACTRGNNDWTIEEPLFEGSSFTEVFFILKSTSITTATQIS